MIEAEQHRRRQRGQGLLEFALALPFLLLLMLGVFEFGRIVFIYSAANNASREAARFGAATGSLDGRPRYLNCAAIRETARSKAFLAGLQDADISIGYEEPNETTHEMRGFAHCGDADLGQDDIKVGDRIVVTITANIDPILSILPLPTFSPTFVTARTILKNIAIGPVECSDGKNNDKDDFIDFPADKGCTGPNDTTEAECFSLSVFGQPTAGGSLSVAPPPNCANRFIEQTDIILGATPVKDPDTDYPIYKFLGWTGTITSPLNSLTFEIITDTEVIANFYEIQADLQVTKTANVETIGSLQQLTYTILVHNADPNPADSIAPDPAHDVTIIDTLPTSATYRGHTLSGAAGTCVPSGADPDNGTGGILKCEVPELPALDTVTLQIVVDTPVANGADLPITNEVTATAFEPDPDMTNNTASVTTTVFPLVDMKISKEGPVDEVDADTEFPYTFTITNTTGPSYATAISVTDTLPAGLEFVGVNPQPAPDPTPSCLATGDPSTGQVVTCKMPEGFKLGVSGTTSFSFRVLAPIEGIDVTNEAHVWAKEKDKNPDDNVSSKVDTTIVSVADLRISKTGDTSVWRDNPINYTITVTNTGPSEAVDVVVTDILTGTVGSFPYSPLPGGCNQVGGGKVTCNVAKMTVGAVATFSFEVTPGEVGTLTNTVEVESTTRDDNPDDNNNFAAPVKTDVNAQVDLYWASRGGPTEVNAGDTFTYTLTIGNHGPSMAKGVSIVDELDATLTYQGFAGTNWSCGPGSGNTVSCTYSGDVWLDGYSSELEIGVTLDPGATAGPSIKGTVSTVPGTVAPDGVSGNNSSTWSTGLTLPPPTPTPTVAPTSTPIGARLPGNLVAYLKPSFHL